MHKSFIKREEYKEIIPRVGLNFLFFFTLIFFISFSSAELQVGIDGTTDGVGINFVQEEEINYSLIPSVNATEFWNTNIGSLENVDATQFENNGGTLNISTTWLTTFGNNLWCALTGCTMAGNINMGNNDITNIDNVEINNDLDIGGILEVIGASYFNGFGIFYNNLYIYNETEEVFLELESENSSEGVQIRLLEDGTNDLYIYTYGSTAAGTYYGLPRAGSSYVDAQGERFVLGTFDDSPMYLSTSQDPRFILTDVGDLIPYDDKYYDIGNTTNRLKDLYILGEDGDGGIRFVEDDGSYGNLSMDDDFNLLWNGNIIGNSSFNESHISGIYALITEPLWSANYTAYNDSWSSTYNSTYDAYNSTGLIINWSSLYGSSYVPYTGATSNLVLGDNNFSVGGTDLFVDNNLGRVGIGTGTPLSLLDVEGRDRKSVV